MVGLEAGLSQVRIARSIGRSPSVVCREIARHRGPGGVYQAQDAGRAAQVARRRPKKRLLDRDEVLFPVARDHPGGNFGALQSINRMPTMGGVRPPAGGFLRIHRYEGKQMPCSISVFLGWA